MQIGIDVHRVIDAYPELFFKLSHYWKVKGHTIHIITGKEWQKVGPEVDALGIHYDRHFSIVDHHLKIGTPTYTRSDSPGIWMNADVWNRSKGDYAMSVGLDLHFDDNIEYAKFFPKCCTYIMVGHGFSEFYYKFLSPRAK